MRSEPLLDALESLIGPEIDAAPAFHLNFKLASRHLALCRETASRLGQPDPTERPSDAAGDEPRAGAADHPRVATPRPRTRLAWLRLAPGVARDRRARRRGRRLKRALRDLIAALRP